MVHVSRLSEELVLWMSQSFGFIELADRFCTGSSIMPQKKNPDVPELARGKTGRVVGHLMGLLMLMKGQPLAYNKDNQEDKEPLFDTVDTLKDTLRIFVELVPGITVKAEAMERAALRGYATATDLADYLVKKGVPFRDAHEAVAKAVKHAIDEGVGPRRPADGRRCNHSTPRSAPTSQGAEAARLARIAQRARRHRARRRCGRRSRATARASARRRPGGDRASGRRSAAYGPIGDDDGLVSRRHRPRRGGLAWRRPRRLLAAGAR